MPGHVKKSDGPDPCPDQWLYVSDELKVKLKSKPYDPKKSCWVPEKATGGYLEGLIENIEGEKATVKILSSGDVSIIYQQFSVLENLSYFLSFNKNPSSSFSSQRCSRRIRLAKSTLQSLTALMIWLV